MFDPVTAGASRPSLRLKSCILKALHSIRTSIPCGIVILSTSQFFINRKPSISQHPLPSSSEKTARVSRHFWRRSHKVAEYISGGTHRVLALENNPYEDQFHRYLSILWTSNPVPGSFFGSAIFNHFAQILDEWSVADPGQLKDSGGKSLLTESARPVAHVLFPEPLPPGRTRPAG